VRGPEPDLTRLSTAARRGTSRSGLPEPSATALGTVLAQVRRETPEATLLARAALAGLHAQAGRTFPRPGTPAPTFTASEPSLPGPPEAFGALLPELAQQPDVLREALTLLHQAGRRLGAAQAYPLLALNDQGGDPLRASLWPVLNEHARWLARLHPVWKRQNPETPSASLYLLRLRRELVEAHAADPEAVAADLLAHWPELKADARRVALGAVASSPHPADWPVLRLALNDRVADVQRQARLLQGHLPGEVQAAVRAALPTWFRRERGKLKVVTGEGVPALGEPDAGSTSDKLADSELGRLLGALPLRDLPALLEATLPEIREALDKAPGHLGELARVRRKVTEDMERAALAGVDLATALSLTSGLGELLEFWPQARLQALLWEAMTRLSQHPDGELTRLTLRLLEALDGPLPRVPEAGTQRPGLLSRVASALGRSQPNDWPTLLHAVAERLLHTLSREVNQYSLPLLEALGPHLDLDRPGPAGPEPTEPPALPEGASPQAQERHTVQLILYRQQLRAQGSLARTLALRRRVRAALAEEP